MKKGAIMLITLLLMFSFVSIAYADEVQLKPTHLNDEQYEIALQMIQANDTMYGILIDNVAEVFTELKNIYSRFIGFEKAKAAMERTDQMREVMITTRTFTENPYFNEYLDSSLAVYDSYNEIFVGCINFVIQPLVMHKEEIKEGVNHLQTNLDRYNKAKEAFENNRAAIVAN